MCGFLPDSQKTQHAAHSTQHTPALSLQVYRHRLKQLLFEQQETLAALRLEAHTTHQRQAQEFASKEASLLEQLRTQQAQVGHSAHTCLTWTTHFSPHFRKMAFTSANTPVIVYALTLQAQEQARAAEETVAALELVRQQQTADLRREEEARVLVRTYTGDTHPWLT
jgi:hypothetical protein